MSGASSTFHHMTSINLEWTVDELQEFDSFQWLTGIKCWMIGVRNDIICQNIFQNVHKESLRIKRTACETLISEYIEYTSTQSVNMVLLLFLSRTTYGIKSGTKTELAFRNSRKISAWLIWFHYRIQYNVICYCSPKLRSVTFVRCKGLRDFLLE